MDMGLGGMAEWQKLRLAYASMVDFLEMLSSQNFQRKEGGEDKHLIVSLSDCASSCGTLVLCLTVLFRFRTFG